MPQAGIRGQTYYNSGTSQAPTWVRAKFLRDLTLPLSSNEIAVKNKGSVWVKYLRGLIDVAIDGEADWEPGSAVFEGFKSSFFTEKEIELMILDGGIKKQGAQGTRASFIVTKFERGEPLEDAMTVSFSLRLAATSAQEPQWVSIGSNGTITVVPGLLDDPNNNP